MASARLDSDLFYFSHLFSSISRNILMAMAGPKESTCNARDQGLIPGSGKSLEESMATHSSILAWRSPWTEEPGGLQSTGLQVTNTHTHTHTHTHTCFTLLPQLNLEPLSLRSKGVFLKLSPKAPMSREKMTSRTGGCIS